MIYSAAMRAPAVLSIFLVCSTLAAQHGSNPAVTIDQSSAGAKLFRAQCAGCHGPDGSGTGQGPSLNSGVFKHGSSDDAIVNTVSKGVPGTTMPGFSYDALQMWPLVAHIRALHVVRAATDVKGDAKAGASLFSKSCAGCHTPAGAFTGPDLAGIGGRRSVVELRNAITDPSSAVMAEHWSIAGRTHSGELVQGIRMNEDTSSIQFREGNGKLRSVLRKNLAEYKLVRTSPMPSFKGKLTDAQVDDLVAFLIKGVQ